MTSVSLSLSRSHLDLQKHFIIIIIILYDEPNSMSSDKLSSRSTVSGDSTRVQVGNVAQRL